MGFKKRKIKLRDKKLLEQNDLKKNIMTTKLKDKNLTSWDDHLDKKYGKKGSMTREKYEEDFETFKIGVLIQEARKRQHLTQEELAIKVGTTKNYISRIENNASDIRLTTLMRIIREGLGGRLKFSVDI
jgi:HTH-type transcriptional regulator/antitoxin HipB